MAAACRGAALLAAALAGAHGAPRRRPGPLEAAPLGYPEPAEAFFQQRLDHFDPADGRRWPQRYLLGSDSWDGRGALPGGCRGPVLLYTGNEGPIDEFWQLTGWLVQELAPKLGALLLYPEQRYYGKSMPFGPDSLRAENARYLTTAQVLEDIADIVSHVKGTLDGAGSCPVVAFGGSYGGTLTALLRATHPATVIGGLAASSELGYYDLGGWAAHGVSQFTFEDVVLSTWRGAREGCLDAAQAALRAIDGEANGSYVAEAFQVCEARALGEPRSTLFAYVLEGMPQGDYPSLGYPVRKACDALVGAHRLGSSSPRELIDAAAGVARTFLGPSPCVAYDAGGPGNTPGDGPGPSAWGYQSCTETLHAFSSRALRSYAFDVERSSSLCAALYNETVRPDLRALAEEFGGGYALAEGRAGVSHLIWSQGTLDPWHGWFQNMSSPPAGSELFHVVVEGAAHHADLRGPSAEDPPALTAAREFEERTIRRWLLEWVPPPRDLQHDGALAAPAAPEWPETSCQAPFLSCDAYPERAWPHMCCDGRYQEALASMCRLPATAPVGACVNATAALGREVLV